MASYQDLWGIPITAASKDAVEHFNETVLSYLGMRVDVGDHLTATLEADPDMPMALIAKANFLKMFAVAKMDEAAAATADKAREVLARIGGTLREGAHLTALKAWVQDDMPAACAAWEAILVDHPRDVLALKLSQLNRFYLGDAGAMRDALGRCWYAWDNSVPAYGFIAGSYAFALEEAGNTERAEVLGREAIGLNASDVWAAHAVAHVFETRCEPQQGLEWLDGLQQHWGDVHNFVHHAHWHRALFALDLGDATRAKEIFDRDVWTDKVADYLDLSNGAALLWRLREQKIDTGDRSAAVAQLAHKLAPNHALAFSDAHIGLALALDGDVDGLFAFQLDMARASRGLGTQRAILDEVVFHLCEAIAADAAGEAGDACDHLLIARPALHRIGGSHAQRDLFARMLIRNAVRAGRTPLAKALVSERLETRPTDAWGLTKMATLSP